MKRYAAHYLYGFAVEFDGLAVVELDNGIVSSFFPLKEEIYSVIWLGGVIILSGRKDYLWDGNLSLPEIVSCLVEKTNIKEPLYAYHIDRVDFRQGRLLPDVSVCRL